MLLNAERVTKAELQTIQRFASSIISLYIRESSFCAWKVTNTSMISGAADYVHCSRSSKLKVCRSQALPFVFPIENDTQESGHLTEARLGLFRALPRNLRFIYLHCVKYLQIGQMAEWFSHILTTGKHLRATFDRV